MRKLYAVLVLTSMLSGCGWYMDVVDTVVPDPKVAPVQGPPPWQTKDKRHAGQ